MFRKTGVLALAAALGLVGAGMVLADRDEPRKVALGLFTSLPVYWGDAGDVSGLLHDTTGKHWARQRLESRVVLRPLDVLSGPGGLDGLSYLLIAQPRPLGPQENVALDAWVREGGRLLLFADPMLTERSAFPLGDRRRPQDTVLLSPILAHWGLRLEFDEDQAEGERVVAIDRLSLPVNLPGRFAVAPGSHHCMLLGEGIVALCRIGKGQALLVADAALLERDRDPGADGSAEMLERFLELLVSMKPQVRLRPGEVVAGFGANRLWLLASLRELRHTCPKLMEGAQDEGRSQGHRVPQQGAHQRTNRDQPVLAALSRAQELGPRQARRV